MDNKDDQRKRRDEGLGPRRTWLPWVVGLAIVGVAAAVRLDQIQQSLWLDELHTAWVASDSWEAVALRARIGNQSPLYFQAMWLVTRGLGLSERSLRLPSFLAGLACVPVLFAWTRRETRSLLAGALAATLVAIDRHAIFFSQEARPYASVQIVSLFQVLAFRTLTYRTPSPGRVLGPRAAFVLLSVFLFHLHYTSALLLGAELSYLTGVILLRKFQRAHEKHVGAVFATLVPWAIDFAVIGLLCLPAASHLREIAARRDQWRDFAAVAPLRIFPIVEQVVVPSACLLPSFVWGWCGSRVPGPGVRRRLGSLMALGLCWLLVPVLLAWLATSTGAAHLLVRRYVIVASLAAPLLAGVLSHSCGVVWHARRRLRARRGAVISGSAAEPGLASQAGSRITWWGSAMVAVVVVAVTVARNGTPLGISERGSTNQRWEDWRGALQMIRESVDRYPVVVEPGLVETRAGIDQHSDAMIEYCLFPVSGMYRIDRERHRIWLWGAREEDQDRLVSEINAAHGLWMLLRAKPSRRDAMIKEVVRDWLGASTDVTPAVSTQAFGDNLTLVRIDL